MDRYVKVQKPKGETAIKENELRVTALGRMRNYMSYAISLFQDKGCDEVVLKATGRAINKTVMIAELLKRRIVGLHQNTTTGSIDITDTWEPLEEGLLSIESTRHVSIITITLSQKELDSSSIGYQSPIPADQVKPLAELNDERGDVNGAAGYSYGGSNGDQGYGIRDQGRGRGRGRGRNSSGRGRNYYGQGRGYNNGNVRQDSGYYNGYDASRFLGQDRGRGRGRGRARGRVQGPTFDRPVQAAA